eukprot:11155204-Lingulodinium_polyedra.AAC.1
MSPLASAGLVSTTKAWLPGSHGCPSSCAPIARAARCRSCAAVTLASGMWWFRCPSAATGPMVYL